MKLKIIKYYIVLIVVFLSWVNFAHASLEITEINNPAVKSNHCWIKVYNNDSNQVNLTEWFVMDYDGTTWHYHKINADTSSTLAPNSYAIIADASSSTISAFKEKNPNISDSLFYGSLTFEKEGTMGLSKDKKTIISQTSYDETNVSSSSDSSDSSSEDNTTVNNDDSDDSSNTNTLSSSEVIPEILKISTKIISPKTIVAGIPFSLSSLTTTNTGKTYIVGNFVWNFGDGMISKIRESGPFDYVYEYPGEYALTISYFDNSFSKIADATNKIIIKVIPSEIYISSVGSDSDPYVEIENKSNYEILLSNWAVTGVLHYFTIPEGTTILPGNKIKLSPKITGFVGEDIRSVVITNPNKIITATYPIQTKKSVLKNSPVGGGTYSPVLPDNGLEESPSLKDSSVINLNDLGASAEGVGDNISKSTYALIGLFVVIGLGIISFLLIKKKKSIDDYVEKDIRAEDMTIIE